VLLCSTLIVTAAKVQCPTCKGTGSIKCPNCQGTGEIAEAGITTCDHCSGTGVLHPTVLMGGMQAEQHDGSTYVTGTFKNKEIVAVTGTVTASLAGHSNSSAITTFPPNQEVSITVQIDYVGTYTMIQLLQSIQMSVTGVEDITCPYCNGAGTTSQTSTCTECQGTGYIDCPTCGGTGFVDEALVVQSGEFPLVAVEAVVGAVAVAGGGAGAFMVLKKRRVSEQSLRRISSREFNDWVLARLDGKAPSSRDTAMGIDGYTAGGKPVLIKQADSIGLTVVDSFASALARNRARNGVIVAFSFGSDAIRGKVRAKMNYGTDIEMLTVSELIYNKRVL
jgi:hypothetical protein